MCNLSRRVRIVGGGGGAENTAGHKRESVTMKNDTIGTDSAYGEQRQKCEKLCRNNIDCAQLNGVIFRTQNAWLPTRGTKFLHLDRAHSWLQLDNVCPALGSN